MRKIVIFLSLWLLVACSVAPVETNSSPTNKWRYVAMGSSYSAGPKLGNPRLDSPQRCGRDLTNYPSLLAAKLDLELVDVSCSGATTAHILGPWNELPAQLDALNTDTRLVTVTIGGNDVSFVRNLYIATCDPVNIGRACPPLATPTEEAWASLETNMLAVAKEVRSRAPNARLVFVDYVSVVPEMACSTAPFTPEKAQMMRNVAKRLAQITAATAKESGADLLPARAFSRLHTPCDPEPWSIGAPGTAAGAPWHPNGVGMHAIADALAIHLRGWRRQ